MNTRTKKRQKNQQMNKIRKKIPLQYQEVIKEFYGRKRMSRLCKTYSVNFCSLLRCMAICLKEGLTTTNIGDHKVIPKWVKMKNKLVVEYEKMEKPYVRVISRHFTIRKARQVCNVRNLDLTLFVKILNSCHEQKVGIWDLSTMRIDIFQVEVPLWVYLSDSNILSPVSEFPEQMA
jgi:hypothetical protein